jgi:hypothetical protein
MSKTNNHLTVTLEEAKELPQEIALQLSFNCKRMQSVPTMIRSILATLPEGTTFDVDYIVKQIYKQHKRAAQRNLCSQALYAMNKAGKIKRTSAGIYAVLGKA